MQKLHQTITINAPKEKVWHVMLDDKSYREWIKAFGSNGYFKGDWNKGSKILFLGPDPETGKESGMVSRIAENKPYEFVSIEHLGIVQEGVEDTESETARQWTPAFENYTLRERDGVTEVVVDLDVNAEHAAMFDKLWADALRNIKAMAESTD